jgi:deoxyribodipyrimidine photo-lyase
MPTRAVVWFRRDLRVADHPALLAALDARRRDTAVEQVLRADGRALHALPGSYLSDFDEIRNTAGDPFRVYSPFARAAKAAAWDEPLPAPTRVPVPDELAPTGTALDGFDLDGAVEVTPPDPAAALARLRWFVERRVDGCARARNSMATDGTSRLSPYLRFGLISPRQVAAAVTGQGPRSGGRGGRETFVNELLWRDFYAYLLYHRPESAWEHMRPELAPPSSRPGGPTPPTWRRAGCASARTTPTRSSTTPRPATAPSPGSRRRVPAAAERPHRLSTISPNPVDAAGPRP